MASGAKNIPKIDSSELKELIEKLLTACHILDHEGVTDGYGHISVRVPGADAFITIANVSPGCVTRDRLIMQDFDGNHLDGAERVDDSFMYSKGAPGNRQRRAYPFEMEHDLQRAADQAQAHASLRQISFRRRPAGVPRRRPGAHSGARRGIGRGARQRSGGLDARPR